MNDESARSVFVVHGRDHKTRDELSRFLITLGLRAVWWPDARSQAQTVSQGHPTTLEIIRSGLSMARAAVILFTADELVRLRIDLAASEAEAEPALQSRPNVIFEAGMALALAPKSTILVRAGSVRDLPSDLSGLDYISLSNEPDAREQLAHALEDAGCSVDRSRPDYLMPSLGGDLSAPVGDEGAGIRRTLLNTAILAGDDAIFQAGVDILRSADHRRVYIYAPTGVWEHNPYKLAWFKQIAKALMSAELPRDERTIPTLDEFIATYGLPERLNNTQFGRALDELEKDRLAPFHGVRSARLYYLDVDTGTIPGSGTILLDESVFSGVASTNRFRVDYGLMVLNDAEYAEVTKTWYLEHVLAISRLLQRWDPPSQRICLARGMNEIRRRNGLKTRALSQECRNGTCWRLPRHV